MSRLVKGAGRKPCFSFWFGLGPGVEELRTGKVWSGPAGRLWNSLLWKEGLDRADFFVTNLRQTYIEPGDGGPYAEIDLLEYDLFTADPVIIVPMGREAARWLLGDVDIEAVHGIPWRVHVPTLDRVATVFPTYNPAAAMHDANSYTNVAEDIRRFKWVVAGKMQPREMVDEHPNPKYTLGFVPYPRHKRVYVDTEGWTHAPWCLSYCCVPGRAHVIRATDLAGLRRFQEMLDDMDEVVLHSAMYDLPVLRAMHIHVRDDQLQDTKVKSYVLGGTEPQGLKALGFRHASMQMQSYDDLTWPYDFVQAYEYLEEVARHDWGKPDPVLERDGGKMRVKQPQGLNTRVKSIFTAVVKDQPDEDEKGRVDPRKRWLKIDDRLRLPAELELGPMPDFSLDLVPIDDAVFYAARDADATCRIDPPLTSLIVSGNHEPVYQTDIAALPMVERMQANGLLIQPGYFPKLKSFFDAEMTKIRKEIESYNGGKYINPGSSQQTAALLFDRLRLPVIKLTGERKPSTADKVLEALRGRHPVVGLICDWRELATLKDKFANTLVLYVGPDGRVRGVIRDTTVVSGRYSMSEPNLMAMPTRTKVGKRIRVGFIAGPGNLLGTADFDQVEMRVMAHLSEDPGMLAAFNEGRDIHGENASMMFGVKLENVDPLLHRYPAKRIGFGIITGITELGLYDQMRLAGIHKYSVNDCADMIQAYFKARPGIPKFLNATRQSAIRDGYVRDMGGRIRFLPGVYSSHPAVREEALRQSHSHVISGTAQWIKKRALKRIWDEIRDLPRGEVEPLLEVHDEVLLEFKQERRDWVAKMMTTTMAADSGLFKVPIKSKFASGPNWGVLKD